MPFMTIAKLKVATPVTEQAHPAQKPNDGGGYSFQVTDLELLDRFLILGTTEDTYYMGKEELTEQAREMLERVAKAEPLKMWKRIIEVSDGGLALKNTPAIVATAALLKWSDLGQFDLKLVIRTGSHLFELAEYIKQLEVKYSRSLRTLIERWYNSFEPEALAYQLLKYKQREGWTHRDILRKAHPKPKNAQAEALFRFAVKDGAAKIETVNLMIGYDLAHQANANLSKLIRAYNLSREMLPTESLSDARVMEALAEKMPLHAMVRNLGNYASAKLHDFGTLTLEQTVNYLSDGERIRKSRLHPLAIYMALKVYMGGHGIKGSKTWEANPRVIRALGQAFELAFVNGDKLDENVLVALDCSGSMDGGYVDSAQLMSAFEAGAAFAFVLGKTNPAKVNIIGVAEQVYSHPEIGSAGSVADLMQRLVRTGGCTNLGAVYEWMAGRKETYGAVVIITDSQVNAGRHPFEIIAEYRKTRGVETKNIVAQVVFNQHTIGLPGDPLTHNIVGFSADFPRVVSAIMGNVKGSELTDEAESE